MGRWVVHSFGALLLLIVVALGLYALSRWTRRP